MPVLSTQLDGVDLVKARVSTASYVGLWSVLSWELGGYESAANWKRLRQGIPVVADLKECGRRE